MKEKKEMSVDELTKEVSRLKSQIGGFRKANDMYRKKIEKLEKLVKHNREVDVEGDHMYEEKLAELERANENIKTKQSIIESFQKKCEGLIIENKALADKVAALNDVLAESEETIFELRKPWWKRIF